MNTTETAHEPPSLIDCETAARALYDYLDGRLPHATRQAVQHHIDVCSKCAGHFRFARRVLELIPSAMPLDADSRALRLKVIESLRAEGFTAHG
jgi:anti-sigma factor RsiW